LQRFRCRALSKIASGGKCGGGLATAFGTDFFDPQVTPSDSIKWHERKSATHARDRGYNDANHNALGRLDRIGDGGGASNFALLTYQLARLLDCSVNKSSPFQLSDGHMETMPVDCSTAAPSPLVTSLAAIFTAPMTVNSVHMLKHWDLIPINHKTVANTISTVYCSVKLQLLASAQVRQEVQAGIVDARWLQKADTREHDARRRFA